MSLLGTLEIFLTTISQYDNDSIVGGLSNEMDAGWVWDRFLVENKNSVGFSYFTQAKVNPDPFQHYVYCFRDSLLP